MTTAYAIGIDVGGTNVKAAAVTEDGRILHEDRFETTDNQAASWAPRIKEHVAQLEREFGPARWIGTASPGLAARDARTIVWMQGRMASVQGFDWTKHLGRDGIVPVLNDAHAAIIGETWLGAAAGARDAVMLTLGTGVGGAIICDGRLLKGNLGRAGHLGHLSLDPGGAPDITNTPGSLEDLVGDHTVNQRSEGRFDSTESLVKAHQAGDEFATRVWLRSIQALAAGLTSIVNAVDPEVVVFGGGIAKSGAALFDPLHRFMDRFEWRPTGTRVRIVPAALGDRAGALGAARNAMLFDAGES